MFKIISACVIGAAALAASAQAAQLSYGTYFKATHNIIKDAVKPYFDGITQATHGDITFKYLTDGTVVGASTTAKGIQQGLVDMGTIVPIYTSSIFPMTVLLTSLPMSKTDSLIDSGAINELFFLHCEECRAEWLAAKIVPLAMYATSPYYLQCAKPIHSLDDVKGRRIQGTGEFGSVAVALGGLPMGLTATEFYTGMSQGTLDCVIGTVAWLTTYGLMDVVKYVVDEPLNALRPLNQMNMNLGKWNRLRADEQKAFTDGLAKLVADSAYGYAEEHRVTRAAGIAAGIQFAPPFAGFEASLDKISQDGAQRFLSLAREKGMKNPERVLDDYLALQAEWRTIVAQTQSPADYEKALQERIFSKVTWPGKP